MLRTSVWQLHGAALKGAVSIDPCFDMPVSRRAAQAQAQAQPQAGAETATSGP